MLDAGVDIKRSFRVVAEKSSDGEMRRHLETAATDIANGSDVVAALSHGAGYFPPLMLDMLAVGEQTGALPEVLRGLAEHYDNQVRLRKDFIGAIAWPAIQFLLAVLIIALLLVVLEWVAGISGGEPLDVLGIGLTGTRGAIVWLTTIFGGGFVLYVVYQTMQRSLQSKRSLDGMLMKIPVLGTCMQSFAVARFSWAFAMTQQAGMSIRPSLEASFRATNNGPFAAAIEPVWQDIKAGSNLGEALKATGLFPLEFLEMVFVAESSGTVPEALQRLSPQFEEQARRSLRALAVTCGWLVWGMVAVFIIIFIFRIAGMYVGLINDAAGGI